MTLSEERVQILKTVFWDMNSISSSTEKVTKQITYINKQNKTYKKQIDISIAPHPPGPGFPEHAPSV